MSRVPRSDPISTAKIEDLIDELKQHFSIVIVTHNLGQAKRISDHCAYFCVERDDRTCFGRLSDFGPTAALVENPTSESLELYLTGKSVRAF